MILNHYSHFIHAVLFLLSFFFTCTEGISNAKTSSRTQSGSTVYHFKPDDVVKQLWFYTSRRLICEIATIANEDFSYLTKCLQTL